ncbi:hypothetical protein PSHT_07548 [Puccinia striiformis]|uniref:Uncharacterized protein n=1 Tax=Puccinia striiformis TaxID=27350 RepID=A0A2S4VX52_9BASI|nr:hypothetical protein PSHT_07548 [Puccinia striiformis]
MLYNQLLLAWSGWNRWTRAAKKNKEQEDEPSENRWGRTTQRNRRTIADRDHSGYFSRNSSTATSTTSTATTTQHHQHQHHYQPVNKQPQAGWKSDTRNFRIQGWDPILIISQILAIQALHYLILSIITPPMLRIFAKPGPLEYEGGAFNVAMIIDWRAMSGSSTLHLPTTHLQKTDTWNGFGKLPESLGRKTTPRIGTGSHSAYLDFDPTRDNLDHRNRSSIPSSHLDLIILTADQLGPDWISQNQLLHSSAFSPDSSRAWVISIAWLISSLIGVIILYEIVRRPKQIMDHSLTTSLNHLILTTYYSSHLPSSIWFYFVLLSSSVLQILITEHICVKREFRDGLGVGWKVDHRPDDS